MKVERRAVARYRAKLEVDIELDDQASDAISVEVSLAGIRLAVEGPIANQMFNQYIQVTPGANVIANIEIKIPDNRAVVRSKSRVISVNRASQSSYLVGLKFLDFGEEDLSIWRDYLHKMLSL